MKSGLLMLKPIASISGLTLDWGRKGEKGGSEYGSVQEEDKLRKGYFPVVNMGNNLAHNGGLVG